MCSAWASLRFNPVTTGYQRVLLTIPRIDLIHQTTQGASIDLDHHLALEILALAAWPDVLDTVKYRFQGRIHGIDLPAHPAPLAKQQSRIGAKVVQHAHDLPHADKDRSWVQAVDVIRLALAQGAIDKNMADSHAAYWRASTGPRAWPV